MRHLMNLPSAAALATGLTLAGAAAAGDDYNKQEKNQKTQTGQMDQQEQGQQQGAQAQQPQQQDDSLVQQAEDASRKGIDKVKGVFGMKGEDKATKVQLSDLNEQQIRQMQQKLSELGFYEGEVDAIAGKKTEKALQAYFRDRAKLAGKGEVTADAAGVFGLDSAEIERVAGEKEQEQQRQQTGGEKEQGQQQGEMGQQPQGEQPQGEQPQGQQPQGQQPQGQQGEETEQDSLDLDPGQGEDVLGEEPRQGGLEEDY